MTVAIRATLDTRSSEVEHAGHHSGLWKDNVEHHAPKDKKTNSLGPSKVPNIAKLLRAFASEIWLTGSTRI